MKNRPIGVFDSGFGGLSITKTLRELFPKENFIYVGDTKNVPYGIKTKEEIKGYVSEVTAYLVTKDVKAIIIACNTATANSDHLKLDVPVIGMIEPTSREASKTTNNKNVLVLATQATVNSNLYVKYLKKYNIKPYQQAAPELVLLVENGDIDSENSEKVVLKKIEPYLEKNLDTVVLGCTHFGFLKKEILKALPNVNLVDGAKEVAVQLKNLLTEKDALNDKGDGDLTILVTGDYEKFKNDVVSLGVKYNKIKKVNI